MLEKIRVVKQSNLERNYHIFYIMAAGASSKDRENWDLKPAQTYHYMNQSGCYDRRDGVKDMDLHVELQEAFSTMGFDRGAQDDCLGCVASILALGNLEFEQIPGARDDEQQARKKRATLVTCVRAPSFPAAFFPLGGTVSNK